MESKQLKALNKVYLEAVYGQSAGQELAKREKDDDAAGAPREKKMMVVTNADKKGNTPAYQNYKKGDKRDVAADHMKEEELLEKQKDTPDQVKAVIAFDKARKGTDDATYDSEHGDKKQAKKERDYAKWQRDKGAEDAQKSGHPWKHAKGSTREKEGKKSEKHAHIKDDKDWGQSLELHDADGNLVYEVIDVIKAEPLVPVKEGHSEYDKFDKERKKADNLKGAKKVAQLMKAAKIRKGVKGPKATKVFGGQEYHDDKVDKVVESKKSKMVSIVKAVSNEKKRKNALQIQKYIGEEEINEISMDTVQSAFDKAGKKADEARDKGDRWEASRRDRQRANIAGMAAGRRRRLDKKKSTLEKIFKSS